MQNIYKYILLWIWLPAALCNPHSVFAQNTSYLFSQLNNNNGLSHNDVNCIFKDQAGFMWIGTMSGLNRYDGYQIKTYKRNLRDTTSLSDDYVERILSGPDGKLWIQTKSGYNIYNPSTERFSAKAMSYFQEKGLKDANVIDVQQDKNGDFWILSSTSGLYKYNKKDQKAYSIFRKEKLLASQLAAFYPNKKGNFWLLYQNGILEELNPKTLHLSSRFRGLRVQSKQAALKLFVDKQDDLWIYETSTPNGIVYVGMTSGKQIRFCKENKAFALNSNLVNGVTQDSEGKIWVATDHGGINLIDKQGFRISELTNIDEDNKSIAQNCINTIYKDYEGIIWTGTFKKGVSYYHEAMIRFPLIKRRSADANSLPYDDVNQFLEDKKGNIWIGTNGGGLLLYNRTSNTFRQYVHNPEDPSSISNNVIVSLCLDSQGELWIGTYYGGLERFDGKRFIHYRHNSADPGSISDDRVWSIFEDSKKRIWVGTLAGGLNLFNRKTNSFKHFSRDMPYSINSGYVSSLLEDKRGNIWIGTSDGVNILDSQTGRFSYIVYNPSQPTSISNNTIATMLKDKQSRIWIATREGLNLFNDAGHKLLTISEVDGLPANTIVGIVEDKRGDIWISTTNGIAKIKLEINSAGGYSYKIQTYNEDDGLQGALFNERSCVRLHNGELIFGGANGFNIFNPEKIPSINKSAQVKITGLSVLNKDVEIGKTYNGNTILKNAIEYTSSITIHHSQNAFSLSFAAMNFVQPDKVHYSYMMEGFDHEWISVSSNNRKATYTNLDPGTYTFRVKTTLGSSDNQDEARLKVIILPPFWKTPLAYTLYLSVLLGILYYSRRVGIVKIERKFRLEQERQEAKRVHELDLMKIKFFTNVSHEFRTPLSLIMAPLDNLMGRASNNESKLQLKMIERNAQRLLHMVNQLLDFRKMEMSEHRLVVQTGDLFSFVKERIESFNDLADKKNINYSFHSTVSLLQTSFDPDKIERILFNLISNAFKFSLPEGSIDIALQVSNVTSAGEGMVTISIRDTGIGIETDQLHLIFEQFTQSTIPSTLMNQGSGIGLAITREFIHLHRGTIEVESEIEKGSLFTIKLPLIIDKIIRTETQILILKPNKDLCPPSQEKTNLEEKGKTKQTVLLVEDNDDFLYYLKENLNHHFQIETATNGKEGWDAILTKHPDLVVSDINMPEMDGIDLCERVKKDSRTAHIPIVLLTAQQTEEQMLHGLDIGASDYITKPFNFQVLLSKIRTLLKHQDVIKTTYSKQITASATEVELESMDDKFIQQLLEVIEENIGNGDFTVEDLSMAVNMSRVTLYKKTLGLTGLAPLEFIKSIRLKKAAQLLQRSQLTIAEVAYEVGFSTPKYFTRLFKAEYGVSPSTYQEQEAKKPIGIESEII